MSFGRKGSRAGGTLKHTTGKAKVRHMRFVMEFRDRLKNPLDRDGALLEIDKLMKERGASEKWIEWFNKIYRAYRNTDIQTYEKKIFNKLKYERAKARQLAKQEKPKNESVR